MGENCLVMRLAGSFQSWGSASQFNRRDTDDRPTKSGVVGLLAAALGRRRSDAIEDLVALQLGVRVDQPGSLLRDYHTVSDLRGAPLRSASTSSTGVQKSTSPKKFTHVTTRFYLQDSVFVAGVGGDQAFLLDLLAALRAPKFPLALGRRACVPTMPLVLTHRPGDLWPGSPEEVLRLVPWQASVAWRRRSGGSYAAAMTVDDDQGTDVRSDVPVSFDPVRRGMTARRVRHEWHVLQDPNYADLNRPASGHDPFAALGW